MLSEVNFADGSVLDVPNFDVLKPVNVFDSAFLGNDADRGDLFFGQKFEIGRPSPSLTPLAIRKARVPVKRRSLTPPIRPSKRRSPVPPRDEFYCDETIDDCLIDQLVDHTTSSPRRRRTTSPLLLNNFHSGHYYAVPDITPFTLTPTDVHLAGPLISSGGNIEVYEQHHGSFFSRIR